VIVRGLRAEGFMRYELLELAGLPRGVIALEGENESGKSTIGEAIAFSLFGRTIRTEDTDPSQAIHWDSDVCTTTIDVEFPGRGVHRIERRVARTGEFEARLTGPEGQELALGPRAVGVAVQRLLGYDFSTFRYSFYVAQGELDLIQREGKDNATRIVCDMLGISTVERAAQRLESEREALLERVSMLDRDLIVANALHTESLPLRDEVAGYEQELTAARAAHHGAEQEEARASEAYQRWVRAGEAQRDRGAALGRLEGSLVGAALRSALLASRSRLTALGAEAKRQAERAEKSLAQDVQAREQAKKSLEKAEAIQGQAQRLEALVAHRAEELRRGIDPDAPDGSPARKRREEETAAKEAKAATWATVLMVVFLLLAGGGGVLAGGFHYPQEKPLFAPPESELVLPGAGVAFEDVTVQKATYTFGALAGLCVFMSFLLFLRRGGAARRCQAAVDEGDRLGKRLEADSAELQACEGFAVEGLDVLKARVQPIRDPAVKAAFDQLQEQAGASAGTAKSPADLLSAAKGREGELVTADREARPRLEACKRMQEQADKAVKAAEAVLEPAFPDGLPAPSDGGGVPQDLGELSAAVEEAAGRAARARVELEALLATGDVAPVADPARELRTALDSTLECLPGDPQTVRASYEDQSGLPELLKQVEDQDSAPTTDGVRAVLKRERELLDDVFGSDEVVARHLREVEDQLRMARVQRATAAAGLQEVVARGGRIEAGRARLAELERKIAGLEEVLRPTQRQAAVHGEAIDMLFEVAAALKARFGPGIGRYIEVVLPRLTAGRYRRVEISPELDLKIYSPERGDFVRLIDLSLGTADQILVSLRLGLARALLASRGIRGGHFLFMDEPLVSADEQREQAFFDLLRTFDEEFAQIFVTSPRGLDPEGPFAHRLHLTRDAKSLRLTAGAPA
jgi:DNA repair exonuclease SbcCD ATPase subunit